MFVYLLRRIFNYVVLLFLATSLAYILASISMDPSTLWDRSNPNLNWNAINANLIKYNISHELPVWDRYTTWLQTVLSSWDWGFTPKGESVNALVAVKVGVSLRLVVLGALIGMVGGVSRGCLDRYPSVQPVRPRHFFHRYGGYLHSGHGSGNPTPGWGRYT